MLAAATGELHLIIPIWGGIALVLAGAAYLVLGTVQPRLFDVLSMTVMGCMAGLVACPWLPLWQPAVVILGGLALGGLTAFFRNVCHAVLSALVLAGVLATLAALAVGPRGFASYLAVNQSNRSYAIQVSGPNLVCDPVLAAALTGILAGATVAIVRFAFSERLITTAQGAALLAGGVASLATRYRGEGQLPVSAAYPLTLSALWLCLVVIGMVAQAALARRRAEWREGADAPADFGQP
ncbi:MAG: hypothetical protein FJ288_09375 [Planctomycetes bacterium]|nr:hypothetical protein [Planctomycetota bacterium]